MADAVTWPRVIHAVPGGERLQEAVVVGVLEVELDHVVVYVLDREGYLHAIHAHPLELQAGHRAGRVLQQRLVYPEPHLLAGLERTADHVVLEDPGDQILRHSAPPPIDVYAPILHSRRPPRPRGREWSSRPRRATKRVAS